MGKHFHPREIMTKKFYDDHVVMLDVANLSEFSRYDLNKLAKKYVEQAYISRQHKPRQDSSGKVLEESNKVAINTVLVIGIRELKMLTAEVRQRQSEYAISLKPVKDKHGNSVVPRRDFNSYQKYPHFDRGTRGAAPARKQRSTYLGLRRFKYGMTKVEGEHEAIFYKLHHYGGCLESD